MGKVSIIVVRIEVRKLSFKQKNLSGKEKDQDRKRKRSTDRDKDPCLKEKESSKDTISVLENIEMRQKKYRVRPIAMLVSLVLFVILILTGYYLFWFPQLVLVGDTSLEVVYPNIYTDPGVKLLRFGRETTGEIQTKGEVLSEKLGNYKITYTYRQFFFHRSITRLVSVVDQEKPILTLKGETEVNVCPNQNYKEAGYLASDNYDGDLTDTVIKTEKDGVITYLVKDSSGNETSMTRNIHSVDQTPPSITLEGSNVVYQAKGVFYQEAGYKAHDTCDGDLTSEVEVSGTVDSNTPGTYTITYKVKDSSENLSVVTRKVVVTEATPPDSSKKGVIYLTFDDGPHGTYTAKILDVLKKYNVKATFFVTMSGPDSMILREYQEGHTVGLHTATHNYKTVYHSVDAYFQDLKTVSNRVKNITGVESKIIRFPGGSSNTISKRYNIGIMSALTKEVIARGYHYFDWNISSGDAGETTSSQGVYNNVIKGLKKNRANVVLMHDIKSYTAEAVEDIVKYGLKNGYTFEAITMSTAMVKQKVNN